MENKVIEVINALCDKFGIAVDWTSQNVFPYVQDLMNRIVQYEIATSTFWIVFFLFLFFVSLKIFNHFMKSAKKEKFLEDKTIIASIVSGIVFAALLICTLIVIPCQFHDIVEAVTIPEKVFIDIISTYGG